MRARFNLNIIISKLKYKVNAENPEKVGDKMEECKCSKDAEIATLQSEVKTLFNQDKEMLIKINKNKSMKDVLFSLDKNMAVQTNMLEHIIEHNIKQDVRADKQEERADKQEERADKQDKIMVQMSANLTKLNEDVKGVKGEVAIVKEVQSENEAKHYVDLRDISKKQYTDILVQYGLPAGGATVLLWQLAQILKG